MVHLIKYVSVVSESDVNSQKIGLKLKTGET